MEVPEEDLQEVVFQNEMFANVLCALSEWVMDSRVNGLNKLV